MLLCEQGGQGTWDTEGLYLHEGQVLFPAASIGHHIQVSLRGVGHNQVI